MGRVSVDLRLMEGRTVGLAMRDGSRIDECLLVAAPRRGLRSVWIYVNGGDAFVSADDIGDAWECRRQ